MKEDLTIQQLKEAKSKLQNELADVINKFEKEYGAYIENLDIGERVYCVDAYTSPYLREKTVVVKLDLGL